MPSAAVTTAARTPPLSERSGARLRSAGKGGSMQGYARRTCARRTSMLFQAKTSACSQLLTCLPLLLAEALINGPIFGAVVPLHIDEEQRRSGRVQSCLAGPCFRTVKGHDRARQRLDRFLQRVRMLQTNPAEQAGKGWGTKGGLEQRRSAKDVNALLLLSAKLSCDESDLGNK